MLENFINVSRGRLVFLQIGMAALLALLFLAIVSPVRQAVRDKQLQLSNVQSQIEQIERKTAWLNQSRESLNEEQRHLIALENQMAPSEMYFWMIKRVREIAPTSLGINVEPPQVEDGDLHCKVPYSMAVFPIKGIGSYQQIGKFIADVENSGSFFVVQKLAIKKVESEDEIANDKLEFRLNLATPMRPSSRPVMDHSPAKTIALAN